MSLDKIHRITWTSKRQEDELLSIFNEMNCDILGMSLSSLGTSKLDDLITKVESKKKIKFNNSIVKTPSGNNSNLSIEGTAALISSLLKGPFIIPPDILDYIREEIPNREELNRYVKNFPQTFELYEKGKVIYEAMIEAGYPTQSAYSLTGATFSECTWNPNVYNVAEKSKSSGTTKFAGGYANCGEGLFGLTNWAQKEKIIKKLRLNEYAEMYGIKNGKISKDTTPARRGITLNKDEYDKGPSETNPLLFQCTERQWMEIMKQYIKDLGKGKGDDKDTIDYLMYKEEPKNSRDSEDDDHKLLYASYLFKAGNAFKKSFDDTKECVNRYKRTHKRIYSVNNPNYEPKNGFVEQLLVAYLLSQYINDIPISDLSLSPIFGDYGELNFVGSTSNGESYSFIRLSDEALTRDLNSKYQPGDGKFDILKACNWFYTNVTGAAKHWCARYVRKALEAGGLDTSKRPNWAWKYINYLPTIGFKFVKKVRRENLKNYTPEVGDISVYMKGNNPSVPGHICMYTDKGWYSDFKQRNMFVYQSTNEAYIFRYEGKTS